MICLSSPAAASHRPRRLAAYRQAPCGLRNPWPARSVRRRALPSTPSRTFMVTPLRSAVCGGDEIPSTGVTIPRSSDPRPAQTSAEPPFSFRSPPPSRSPGHSLTYLLLAHPLASPSSCQPIPCRTCPGCSMPGGVTHTAALLAGHRPGRGITPPPQGIRTRPGPPRHGGGTRRSDARPAGSARPTESPPSRGGSDDRSGRSRASLLHARRWPPRN